MTETPTAQQSPEEMVENFREQQKKTAEALQQLDAETSRQKELYLKLQGAIEGIELLHPEVKKEEEAPAAAAPEASPEASPEAVTEAVS